MEKAVKTVTSQAADGLMDTIRTRMADKDGSVSAPSDRLPAGEPVPSAQQQAQEQFAKLQVAVGKFTDEQLLSVLAHVSDCRLAVVLARRLSTAATGAAVTGAAVTGAAITNTAASAPQTPQPQSDPADQREAERTKVLRSGKIIYNNKMSVTDCQIRDISDTGCRIVLESTAGIPNNFTLHILHGDMRRECEAAWRTSTSMGLKFIL